MATKVRGRFVVLPESGWTLADNETGMCVSDLGSRRAAEGAATFARAYAKKWGGIDLGAFPYRLEQPWDGTVDGEKV